MKEIRVEVTIEDFFHIQANNNATENEIESLIKDHPQIKEAKNFSDAVSWEWEITE